MAKVKNKHRIKQREWRNLLDEIHQTIDPGFTYEYRLIETGKIDDIELIFLDDIPYFFRKDTSLFFTLKGLMIHQPKKKSVIVDMGAVKFVTNGADVMAPGIMDADKDIAVDDHVWIGDETHRKPLAVGIALISGEDMVKSTKGKAITLTHHIGDSLWKMLSSL